MEQRDLMIDGTGDIQNIVIDGTGTGSIETRQDHKTVTYPFGRYVVKVEVGKANEFVGIVEVKVNKDFLTHEQRVRGAGGHDVDEFYADE